ncbi:MAG: hypothetical protein AB1782_05450 [Cyanobacteriota bacterium]
MNSATLDSKSLKMEILPEGQELVREIMQLATKEDTINEEINSTDLAVVVSDALMYYKILLEHKTKGGDIILKLDNQEVKLPVIASIN